MDADRVRSYLQVACAGLGFDIGEVWWMNNESGTSTVASIQETNNGHESDSSSEFMNQQHPRKSHGQKKTPKKRFLQLYTSKAYCNQRSKLVQPHDTANEHKSSNDDNNTNNNNNNSNNNNIPNNNELTLHRTSSAASLELDSEHVLSPRIVEAVTQSTQVVWANCQKTEGLLGRSDIKLQTAIGMPVGIDENGNVWVVVMFSPKNVESTSDAIEYLQYISRSAASTSIPCLLPVVGDVDNVNNVDTMENGDNPQHHSNGVSGLGRGMGGGTTKMICNGSNNNHNNNNNNHRHELESNNSDNDDSDNDNKKHISRSLISIKPTKQPEHTQELGDGVTAKFVSFNLNDDDDYADEEKSPEGYHGGGGNGNIHGGVNGINVNGSVSVALQHQPQPTLENNDLCDAPKDDWGIPMLPEETPDQHQTHNPNDHHHGPHQQLHHPSSIHLPDAIDSAITDAFDEASYGVWSTIMNLTAGGGGSGGVAGNDIGSGEIARASEGIAAKMHLIQERLEEFATAFLGMSVFDVADAWTVTSASSSSTSNGVGNVGEGVDGSDGAVLKCLFTVAATDTDPGINALREVSSRASVRAADGAVGKAYSSGYPVWSSDKDSIFDAGRRAAFRNCKIQTALSVPIFTAGESTPSCVLSAYSLLPASSVPFVLNFVQKAVRLLWSGLDRVVNPHESVGRELWKDVGPADLGEMAADVEMQRSFIGKKRPRGESNDGCLSGLVERGGERRTRMTHGEDGVREEEEDDDDDDERFSIVVDDDDGEDHREDSPMTTATKPLYPNVPINAPPKKGMAPAPLLPHTVQQRSPNAQQFVFLDTGQDGHWAVRQAVQHAVRDVRLWNEAGRGDADLSGGGFQNSMLCQQQQQQQQYPMPTPRQPLHQQTRQPAYQMSYVNYQPKDAVAQQRQNAPPSVVGAAAYPPTHTDDPATIHANLMEFNAMAQMHTVDPNNNPIAPTVMAAVSLTPRKHVDNNNNNGVNNSLSGTDHAMQNPPPPPKNNPIPTSSSSNNNNNNNNNNNGEPINLDKMVVIPISHAEGSVILTGPRQSMMYCTPTATAAAVSRLHPTTSAVVGARPMDPSLFALEDRKPCRIEGCVGVAVSKRPYCARHCGNRQCERVGCTKCAQGATRFCIAHGGGRRCTFPGCDKGARDKYFCAAHGGGKRCKKDGCSKSAVGGSNFCTGHGGGKRCQVPGCEKSAQSSTKFCVKHGGGKKCQQDGCEKVARGRTLYCAAHGGGVRCKLEGCNRVAIGKAQLCRAHGGGANSHFNAAAI